MFSIATIMKAIELVGPITEAGKAIYEGFKPLLHGADQDELKTQYSKAIEASDADHADLQDQLKN